MGDFEPSRFAVTPISMKK